MRCAVVDIGSNTARMNIYDTDADINGFKLILTECENLGFLNYISDRIISAEGIAKLIEVLRSYKNIAENVGCDKSCYFATAALRFTDNAGEVIEAVKIETGINIELIAGENEAYLSFEGLKVSFDGDLRCGIMIDMGGGSTELLGFIDGMAVKAESLPFGGLSLYKKFVSSILPEKEERKKIKDFTDACIAQVGWLKNYGDTAYLVGGTARSLGKLRDLLLKNGVGEPVCRMTSGELRSLSELLKTPDNATVRLIINVVPDRLHTLIPGLLALSRILGFAGSENIIVSPTGIREGFLKKRILKQ